jgi:hypothetical protein
LSRRIERESAQGCSVFDWETAMSIYRFVLCGPGAAVEELGSLLLRDDSEAVAFGQSVVRDMVQGASPQQAAVVEVIDGERTVSRIDRD